MGSFRKRKAKNIVKIGESVCITDASIVAEIVMAFKKVSCGTNSPTNEASTISPISFRATGSLGMNSDNSQNSAAAPMARSVNSSIGDNTSELAISLQNTRFNPKIVYAPATARCPRS